MYEIISDEDKDKCSMGNMSKAAITVETAQRSIIARLLEILFPCLAAGLKSLKPLASKLKSSDWGR